MNIHYITGLAAVVLVGIHVTFRLIMPYGQSLEYENVIANYKNMPYALVLELILVTVAIHGFNGLRIILVELRQGEHWEKGVKWACVAAVIAIIAYGSRTIIMANMAGTI
jgi:succinate dehydrogenase / fumarate reductase membrane anchor subunit